MGFLQVCRLQRCGLRSGWGQATAASSIWGLGPWEGRVGLKSFFWGFLLGFKWSQRFREVLLCSQDAERAGVEADFRGFSWVFC